MEIHERAVEASMTVECKKDSLRQNQDGTWKFTLTVAPDDMPDSMLKAPPGTRYQAVFVEVDDAEEPVKHAPATAEKPRTPFHDRRLSQQAGIRCGDVAFQHWLGTANVDETAEKVRRICCDISTRAALNTDVGAATAWKALNAEYEQWAGLAPEQR